MKKALIIFLILGAAYWLLRKKDANGKSVMSTMMSGVFGSSSLLTSKPVITTPTTPITSTPTTTTPTTTTPTSGTSGGDSGESSEPHRNVDLPSNFSQPKIKSAFV